MDERAAKRARPSEAADAPAGSPLDITVLQHQNKMLSMRLQTYKRDLAELERKNENFASRQLAFDTTLSTVNRYWNQLNENLKVILARISPTPLPPVEEEKPEDVKEPSFLQRLLELNRPIQPEDLEMALHNRCEFTAVALGQIVGVLEAQEDKYNKLFAMFRDETDPAKKSDAIWQAIQHDNQVLREAHERNKVVMDTLQVRHHNIMAEMKELQDINLFCKQRLADLETENERLRTDFRTVDRKLAKLQDQMEQQRQNAVAAQEEKNKAAATTGNQAAPSPTPPAPSQGTSNGPTVEKSELEIAETTAKTRLEEIERLREQKVVIEQELQRLKTQNVVASDEAVSASPKFRILQHHFQIQAAELQSLRAKVETQTREIQDLRESAAADLERLGETEKDKREALEGKLKEAEAALGKLREEREQLNGKLLQLQKGTSSTSGIRREDLVTLERTLQHSNRKLSRQCAELKTKLDEKDKEKEGEINERVQAKNGEVKELQEKLARSQERVRQLETGGSSGAGAQASPRGEEAGPKSVEELQTALRKREVQLAKAEKGLGEVRAQLEAAKAEQEAVLAELEAVSKEFEALQDQNVRLAKELTEKDDANTQLIAERIKASQQQAAVAAERDALARKIGAMEEALAAQAEHVKRSGAQVATAQEQAGRAVEEARAAAALVEALKRAGREHQKEAGEARVEAEAARNQLADVQRRLDEKIAEHEAAEHRRRRVDEQLADVRKRLEKETERRRERERGGGRDGELEELMHEELKATKEKLKCSVCHLRPKEVIIARCFHMFCQHCIQKSLQVRNRKCPACGEKYGGESDIHTVFF